MPALIEKMRIEVEGQEAITNQLKALDRKVRKKILKRATTAATKELHKEARRLAPRKTGMFRMSLKVQVKTGKSAVFGKVGQEKKRKFNRKKPRGSNINRRGYAAPIHFIEMGTKQHEIKGKDKPLAWSTGKRKGKKGTMIIRRSVKHPGTKGQQVLERAGRLGGPVAAQVWRSIIVEELAKPLPASVS